MTSVLVFNEQTKLLATWFNSASIAMLAAGFLAPLSNVLFLNGSINVTPPMAAMAVSWFSSCFALRIQAHITLKDMIDDESL